MIEQIAKIKNEGPSEEVRTARDSYVNNQVFDCESSSVIVDRLAWDNVAGLPLDTVKREFRIYQSATLEDVRRVAGDYLHPESLTILVVGNRDLSDRPSSDFGKVNVIEIREEVTE